MRHFKNHKKISTVITAAATTLLTIMTLLILQMPAQAILYGTSNTGRLAPVVVSGGNIYIAWWTNNTENGNEEVMFRASNDDGATFGDKINLSNSPSADSWRVEIAAEGADVIVSWWETNQTSDIPVARISTDGGETFGPMIMLATNGTIGSTEEGGIL